MEIASVPEDAFAPGQILAFGNIMLHVDRIGRLGQVKSFTPDQEIRFRNLEFITDSRGDLTLTKFSAPPEELANPVALTSGAVNLTGADNTGGAAVKLDPIAPSEQVSAEHR